MRRSRGRPVLVVVANLVNLLTALISAPLMARALGPEGRGDASAAIAAFNILPIVLAAGIPLVVRRRAAKGYLAPAVRTARILALAAMVPAVIASVALTSTVFGSLDEPSRLATLVGLAFTPLIIMWMIESSALVGVEHYLAVLIVRISQPFAVFLYLVLAGLSGTITVSSLLWAQIASHILTLILASSFNRVAVRGPRLPILQTVREGVSLSGGAIAEALSYRLDQVLVLPLAGAMQAGFYSIASVVGSIPLAVAQAVSVPHFRQMAVSTRLESRAVVERGFREVASSTFAATLLVSILTPFVIPMVFGDDFTGAIRPAVVYLLGSFFLGCSYYCSLMLVARGSGLIMTVGQILALVVDLGLLVTLAPGFGALGAAISSSVAYTLLCVFFLIKSGYRFGYLMPSLGGLRDSIGRLFSA